MPRASSSWVRSPAAAWALYFYGQDGWWILPLMSLAAVAGGMAWGAIPALLKTRLGTSEILVSLMLTYVAEQFLSYLVLGPWKDPEGMNFPQSRMFSDSATLPILIDGTRVHAGVLVALAVVLGGWFVMSRSILGFEIRTVGSAPAAARYAGFSQTRVVWLTLMAASGLAGLAGLFEVAGPIGQIIPKITPGYGFTAIIVAFLGRLHPLGILLAGLRHGLVLHRRRPGTGRHGPAQCRDRPRAGHAPVLPARLGFPGALPRADDEACGHAELFSFSRGSGRRSRSRSEPAGWMRVSAAL